MRTLPLAIVVASLAATCPGQDVPAAEVEPSKWKQLFNGKDLTGWKPKIRGHELGENFGNTFRVEDGVLEILEEVAGGDLDDFYATFIENNGHPEFNHHLDVIGCELGEGGIRRVEDPTAEQVEAFEDFFSPEG